MSNLMGETKIDAPMTRYWNSKKTPATKGDQVKGVHIRQEADEYKGKPTTRHVLRGDDGNEITLPNHTILNGMMARVPIGKVARVVYIGKGEAARGRSAPELYEVYMSDAPTETPAPPTPAIDEATEKAIIDELALASNIGGFLGGLIPELNTQACVDKHLRASGKTEGKKGDVIKHLKDRGMLQHMEDHKNNIEGYRVIV